MNDDSKKKHLKDIRVRLWRLQKNMRDIADDIFALYMELEEDEEGDDDKT